LTKCFFSLFPKNNLIFFPKEVCIVSSYTTACFIGWLGNNAVDFGLLTTEIYARGRAASQARTLSLHHNTEMGDGRSDAKSGYSNRQSVAKKL
jgi:hypothetical protein